MSRRDSASERQAQASDPRFSVWLSANAGSGKTKVLTDRVARLLLDGVAPLHILCLTYTKAAASEMQNRLFQRLGEWAMMADDALRTALIDLGAEGPIDADILRRARRLFAKAIETPGGLKIQTIHSFCASLLRRFPLEAGVSPQFKEMDDRAAKLLRSEVVEEMADGPQVALIDGLARFYTGEDLDGLTKEVARHREAFSDRTDQKTVWSWFGLAPQTDENSVLRQAFCGDEGGLLKALVPMLLAGLTNDIKAGKKLLAIDPDHIGLPDLEILESVFLTGKGAKEPFTAKINAFPTKATQKDLGSLIEPLNAFMQRIEAARQTRLRLYAARKTLALHEFAKVFLDAYEVKKQRHGWLDFDDLILRARHLLSDSHVAQWVLFRLDGGIDHILVDEAQDTSPAQWDVIRYLAQEFTSGQGARADIARTIFVVGDKKQSIYSFQGADPDGFDRMGQFFGERLRAARSDLQRQTLEFSFRSAAPVLQLVDNTFRAEAPEPADFATLHRAFKAELPGRVDQWPLVPKAEETEDREWFDPVDRIAENHHSVKLARHIAEQISVMLENASIPAEAGRTGQYRMRRVRPGDILILVQGRQALFSEIIQACKREGLPIAGADVLKIGAELAVKDLTALLSFMATPEDDLSLATALRSPLFGWREQDLFDLAHNRPKSRYLYEALRKRRADYAETVAKLETFRDAADFLRPFELLECILTRHGGRKALLARLGAEAEDGIDALLAQAQNYETMDVPSLTGFLTWLHAEEVTIKRKIDSASDQIRVMTVHGAKGLESPIVILPDTLKPAPTIRDELLADKAGRVFWKTGSDTSPEKLAQLREALKQAQVRERSRLLYVAMTRAEKWLIVCGAGDLPKKDTCWYQTIEKGMRASGAVDHDFALGTGLRLESGNWDKSAAESHDQDGKVPSPLPDWANKDAVIPPRPEQTLSPSGLGGAKVLTGDAADTDEDTAKRRGRQIHLLLEHLPDYPPQDWPRIAASLLSTGADAATPDEVENLLADVDPVLNNPELAFLFSENVLAEVPVSATLAELGNRRIHGTIDRLLVEKMRVMAVDFKTNALVPDHPRNVPDGLLRQMGAYGAALAQIFPDRRIDLAILWTQTGQLMPLSHDLVTAALQTTQLP